MRLAFGSWFPWLRNTVPTPAPDPHAFSDEPITFPPLPRSEHCREEEYSARWSEQALRTFP